LVWVVRLNWASIRVQATVFSPVRDGAGVACEAQAEMGV
jgi:hypothetical protein